MRRKTVLLITPGDPEGIGPEIAWAAFRQLRRTPGLALVLVGAKRPFARMGAPVQELSIDDRGALSEPDALVRLLRNGKLPLLPAPERAPGGRFLPGYQSGWAVGAAVRLIRSGRADALVTGPLSKARLNRGGFPFPGHTELLAHLCGVRDVTMMLANSRLRVSLVTTHLSLADVPSSINRRGVRRALLQTLEFLQRDCGIRHPRIALAALNPHAGEGGLFGNEEKRILAPEIRAIQRSRKDFCLLGPFPADTLFARHVAAPPQERFDAIVCMYHDQGLVPVKLLDFPKTVNVTLGLPIVRTSVDHGTGFDLVGTGKANPSSLVSAIRLAQRIIENRKEASS
jgi:4-hydroxythreonine-4-phosphate dehydrogenase